MQSINRMGSRALGARGFAAVWAVLVMGLGALAWPATALAWTGQPLAYVANFASNSISVVDTGDNTVVDTIGVGNGPEGIEWLQMENTSMSRSLPTMTYR
jgi:YVTN family beta-propeller protein